MHTHIHIHALVYKIIQIHVYTRTYGNTCVCIYAHIEIDIHMPHMYPAQAQHTYECLVSACAFVYSNTVIRFQYVSC
jgi:hypothetical protein